MVTTTPEEYFAAQTLDMPPEDAEAPLNAAERAFVQKYLGGELLEAMPVQAPQTALPGLGGRSLRQRGQNSRRAQQLRARRKP